MILSMTGFGRGIASSPTKKITIEIKSLNSKQFDLAMRVPPFFKELEVEARNRMGARLERGKVELTATAESIGKETPVTFNTPVLAGYKEQIEKLAIELGIPEPADWYNVLLRLPDATKAESTGIDDADRTAFFTAVSLAVIALEEFRTSEGRKLYSFFVKKIENLATLLSQVDGFEAERVPKIRARIEEQLTRLDFIEYDRGRLEQELIFYIEKLDVTEEKTRLRAHLNYFMETLGAPDGERTPQGQGKKLGFIAQEIGREINTLGSKSNNADMQRIVVQMKDELEQIKEQVLNVL